MLENTFETGINLLETFIIFEFLTKYLGCKYDDYRKKVGFIIFWLVEFFELCIRNYITEFESLGTYIPIVIYFSYAIFFLQGSVLMKLWMSVLIQIIVSGIAIITNLLICNVIGYNPSDMISIFNSIRVVGVIITKIILFYLTRIILKNKYKNPIDTHQWVMLVIIPIISIISLAALMKAALNHEEIKVYILIGNTCIVIANIITYYFFTVISKEYATKLKIQLLEQQNENSKKNIENVEAFINQMKSVRHDIKNQLITIYGYIESNKINEAKKYINNLTNNYLPNMQDYINTNNVAFDAIVNSKIAICNQKKIFMIVRVMQDSLKNFDPTDVGILFGNLLDNAIDASEQTQKRRITVDVETKGEYLSVLISNSIDQSVLKTNTLLETTKKNKESHGIGIKSVKTVVQKYDGMIQFFEESNEFCCHILLDLNKK